MVSNMLKSVLIFILVTACLASPQRHRYFTPTRSFSTFSGNYPTSRFSSDFFGSYGYSPFRHALHRRFDHGSRFGIGSDIDAFSLLGSRGGYARRPLNYDGRLGFRNGVFRDFGANYGSGSGFRRFSGGFPGALRGYSGNSPAILRSDREDAEDGSYAFTYETEDGVAREETGVPGPNGAIVKKGSYSFTFPDGTPGEVRYIADENGFRAESDLIPVAPEHTLAQVEKAEQERAAGILHDGQYLAEDHYGDNLHSSPFTGTNRRALFFSRGDPRPFLGAFRSPFSYSNGRDRNTLLRSGIYGDHFDRAHGTAEYDESFTNRNLLRNRFSGIRTDFGRNSGIGFDRGPYDDHTSDLTSSQRVNDYDGIPILT